MNEITVKELLKKYTEGTCSLEEQALVDRWYLAEAAKRPSIDPKEPLKEQDSIWNSVQKQLSLNGLKEDPIVLHTQPTLRFSLKWVVAASIILVISVIMYQINGPSSHETLMAEIRKNDIAPGKNKATLILPNGKTIRLSDDKAGVEIDATTIQYSDGTAVTDTVANDLASDKNEIAEIMKETPGVSLETWNAFSRKMLTVSTPRGGTYKVVLPDGSKVWLNADSWLSFPKEFDKKAREVMLIGEAYFEIAKKSDRPFRVMSKGQRVTVLGTQFNINAYREDLKIETTLIEGMVQVQAGASNEQVTLKPGQQAIMNQQDLKITQANIDQVLAWRNGKFRFANEDIKSIMGKISRWYDVDIVYHRDVTKEKFSGQVSRFGNVSEILEVLQLTGFVHFKIEGPAKNGAERRIVVLP